MDYKRWKVETYYWGDVVVTKSAFQCVLLEVMNTTPWEVYKC